MRTCALCGGSGGTKFGGSLAAHASVLPLTRRVLESPRGAGLRHNFARSMLGTGSGDYLSMVNVRVSLEPSNRVRLLIQGLWQLLAPSLALPLCL